MLKDAQVKRDESAEKLVYIIPRYIKELAKNDAVQDEDKKALKELSDLVDSDYVLSTELLKYKVIFKKYLKLQYLSHETLLHIAHLLGLKPATGLNTINNILNLCRLGKFQIPINAPVIKYMTKFFLIRELNIYMQNLRKQDEIMSFQEIDQLEES